MPLTQVAGPYPIFIDLDGSPLDDGYLYFGDVNQDPETNPIQAYWDSALTIPATQPIRTSNGYAWRNGTPGQIYTSSPYSITIRNKKNEFVLYSPAGYGFDPNASYYAPVVKDDFTGDGMEVNFTLSSSPSTILATNVYVNGLYQEKDDYTLAGNVITFLIAPALNASIEVITNETGIVNSTNAGLVTYTAGYPNAVAQTVQDKLEQYVCVKDFGAVGDGVTDDTTAIQNALNGAPGAVYFPAGTYVINATIEVPKNVSIVGDGANVTIIDASNTPDVNITEDAHLYTPKATYTALSALSLDVVKNGKTLTFASAPNVNVGDVLVIYNPTNFSWSGYRSYYHAGEYVRVADIAGSVVTIEGSTCAAYVKTAVTVYRLDDMSSGRFHGFSIIGKPNSALPITGLKLQSLVDSSVEDVRVTDPTYIGISTVFCYNVQLRNCTATDDFGNQFGGEYGLAVINSQIINVSGGNYSSSRHGITMGGASGTGAVPNRYVNVIGATISTQDGVQAADIHGNAEYCGYFDCIIDGGLVMGGDYITADNNQIRGKHANGPVAVLLSEMKGASLRITNNTIQNNQVAASRGALIDIGGNDIVIGPDMSSGGNIVIEGNTMLWEAATTVGYSPVNIYNRGYAGSEPVSIYFNNNKIYASAETNGTATTIRKISSGSIFATVQACNNVIKFAGGISVYSDIAETVADDVQISGNLIQGASTGINALSCARININENSLYSINARVLEGSGRVGSYAQYVEISNNVVFDGPYVSLGSSTEDVSIRSIYSVQTHTNNNTAGTNGKSMLVASSVGFQVGDTITGSTSGETATVLAIAGNYLGLGTTSSGPFTPGETVTGAPSGASSTVTSVNDTVSYFRYFGGIDNLYRGNDVNTGVGVDGLGSITNDISTYIAPRYSTAERNALTMPKAGQIILNTSTGKLNFYTGAGWEAVTSV